MVGFSARLSAALTQRAREGLYRHRLTLESSQGPVVRMAGRTYLNFCSNDYLGLAAHPKVIEALCSAAEKYGVGSGGSHLVCGHSAPHHQLEEALADFTGRPRALLFSSGYMANTIQTINISTPGNHLIQVAMIYILLLNKSRLPTRRFLPLQSILVFTTIPLKLIQPRSGLINVETYLNSISMKT